ncbi:amino acid ABC transporter ATP-binding protein [Acuticoccus sp. 2012]|uniref:Amino acid ABC transporter ATP-binding protein n=2 Tax=Acuticoccus mangrovi TaxID=2796142 RepID=A0A934IUH7_9HYPH|nr:amino acid ABC transporter ATP-binding protein [Acuticoccus mangrovi]
MGSADDVVLEAVDIRKAFGTHEVLCGASLSVQRQEVISIIGSSGSGKSTFLRCLNMLEIPQGGQLRIGAETYDFSRLRRPPRDAQLARLRRNVGMVFQHFNLFPHKTAMENIVEGPIQVLGESPKQARETGMELLVKVGLQDKADQYPQQLSGGQKQRVAIARALAMRPELILFDEVTSALDPELVGEVLTVLKDLAAEGTTMILVTHEIAFAADISDRVGFMVDGTFAELGTPQDVIYNPKSERLVRFLERFTSGNRI